MPLAGTFHQIDGVRVHCRESGHAPMEERPESFCAAALPFLQGAAPADGVVR